MKLSMKPGRLALFLVLLCLLSPLAVGAQAAGTGAGSLDGTIVSIKGNVIVLTLADMTQKTVTLKDGATILDRQPATADQIKAGDALGVAAKSDNGTLVATSINIFAPQMWDVVRKGQFPMTTGETMTNALIAQVVANSQGRVLTMKLDMGNATIVVPDGDNDPQARHREAGSAHRRAARHGPHDHGRQREPHRLQRELRPADARMTPSSEDVQQFHRWSRTYERSLGQVFIFGPAHRAVLGAAAAGLDGRAPGAVLDIGCGTGRLLRRASARWPDAAIIGVDPAQGMIDVARELTPGAEFHVGHGEHLPLADASVEAAFSTISFHHWQDQAAGVREVARVLRRGGTFCLADINLPLFTGRLIPHARVHTRGEMAALFTQAGLAIRSQNAILGGTVLVTVGTKG